MAAAWPWCFTSKPPKKKSTNYNIFLVSRDIFQEKNLNPPFYNTTPRKETIRLGGVGQIKTQQTSCKAAIQDFCALVSQRQVSLWQTNWRDISKTHHNRRPPNWNTSWYLRWSSNCTTTPPGWKCSAIKRRERLLYEFCRVKKFRVYKTHPSDTPPVCGSIKKPSPTASNCRFDYFSTHLGGWKRDSPDWWNLEGLGIERSRFLTLPPNIIYILSGYYPPGTINTPLNSSESAAKTINWIWGTTRLSRLCSSARFVEHTVDTH